MNNKIIDHPPLFNKLETDYIYEKNHFETVKLPNIFI